MEQKKSSKSSMKKTFTWSMVAIVALLVVMSFQMAALNRNIALINAAVVSGSGAVPSNDNNPGSNPGNDAGSGNDAPSAVDMESLMDDDAIKGDANAPVTIVEWTDYECPFCTRFFEQTYPQIEEEYIETGKVKFIVRDFPLSFHQNAQKAAEAAECAGEQGKYFEMHDKLFVEGVSGGVESFKQYAADLGLNTEAFNACLDSGEMAAEVSKDMRDGQAVGIRGTPGFVINGQTVSGAQPFANFKQVIDAALAET